MGHVTSATWTYTGLPTQTFSYTYLADGTRHTMAMPGDAWSYGYDADGRPSYMTSAAGLSTIGYDDAGRQTFRGLPNGAQTSTFRDALGDATRIDNTLSGAFLSQYTGLQYDGAFELTGLNASVTGVASHTGSLSYAYDAKDRLTLESSSRLGGYSEAHGYDAAGNPTTLRGASQSFDADNQLTNNAAYDGNGSPTTYRGAAMAYDPEGRATSVGLGSGLTAGYRADGLRAWKSVGGVRTYYLYDRGEPVVELDASGNVKAENAFAPDGLVARKVGSGGWTQYAFDAQGNVAQRLDSAGNVQSSSVYDAYGQESSTTTPSDPFGYNGRWGYYADRETGLCYCRNRYYDPAGGHWLTRDPIGFEGGINTYGYCAGAPVGSADPNGLLLNLTVGLGPGPGTSAPPSWFPTGGPGPMEPDVPTGPSMFPEAFPLCGAGAVGIAALLVFGHPADPEAKPNVGGGGGWAGPGDPVYGGGASPYSSLPNKYPLPKRYVSHDDPSRRELILRRFVWDAFDDAQSSADCEEIADRVRSSLRGGLDRGELNAGELGSLLRQVSSSLDACRERMRGR